MSDRQRFYSRLATVPGVRPMPSVGDWILLQVDDPSELARKVNRRLQPGMVSVPRLVDGAIRVPVRDPKSNEALFEVLREICIAKARRSFVDDEDEDDAPALDAC